MSIRSCQMCKYRFALGTDLPCSECNADGDKFELLEISSVDHPQHYNHGAYECIDVMVENFGKEATQHFCLLNAFKYVWRTNYKNGITDVKKAMWYLDKYLELEGEKYE